MPEPSMGQMKEDQDLTDEVIIKAMGRDQSALALIFDLYARRVYRYLYSRVNNVMDAEDLLTQTFMKVLEALPGYQHQQQFTAWIFRIARSKAIDHFRRQRPSSPLEENISDGRHANSILENVIQYQDVEKLGRLLQDLEEEELELLRLRFVADLTFVEIAALLGRKEDAVRKSVQRILNRLYGQMEVQNA
jgi:RNA polymerase sigma-70 factor (ECF subfamily)